MSVSLFTPLSPLLAAAPRWWVDALGQGELLFLGGLAMTAAAGLAAATVALIRVHAGRSQPSGEAGTATIEFALIFPVMLFLALLLIQTTLLMVGQLFVHYGAFTATRAAIVQIPRHEPQDGEPVNAIRPGEESEKFQTIRRAGVFAVTPIAGESKTSRAPGQSFARALQAYYDGTDQSPPAALARIAAGRLHYAHRHTEVTLLRAETVGQRVSFDALEPNRLHLFGPRQPITVQLNHRFYLAMPYIRLLFADGRLRDGTGGFAELTAQYTLTNEGLSPRLPESPSLQRRMPDS